jgi:NitT/TauT family transport system substrate-binding protein
MKIKTALTLATACIVFVGVAMVPSGMASPAESDRQTETYKAAGTPSFGPLAIYVAREKGFYRQAGVDVSPGLLSGSTALLTGVVSGAIHFGVVNWIAVMGAHTQGLPVVAVAPGSAQRLNVGAIVVKADSNIRTAKDIEGKIHSVSSLRGSNEMNFRTWMTKRGADPGKVTFVSIPANVVLSAILSGRIDSGYVAAPFLDEARRDKARFRIVGTDDNAIVPFGVPQTAWIANANWAKSNPGVVKKFAAVIVRANKYIQTHPRESKAFMAKPDFLGISVPDAQATVIGGFPSAFPLRWLQVLADTAARTGFITKRFNVREVISSNAPVTK